METKIGKMTYVNFILNSPILIMIWGQEPFETGRISEGNFDLIGFGNS